MGAESLKVYFHENHIHRDLRGCGRDRHLPEPNRGLRTTGYVVTIDLTLTQPTDLVNQSIPFSFLSVQVSTNDGQPHKVQLYTDISGEWLAQSDQDFVWEAIAGGTINHRFWLKDQTPVTEVGGRIRDGSVIYSTKQVIHLRETQPVSFSKHFRSTE